MIVSQLAIKHSALNQAATGKIPYNKAVSRFDSLLTKKPEQLLQAVQFYYDNLTARIKLLDDILLHKTYLVGERITLADICVLTGLTMCFTGALDKAARENVPNVMRYIDT